MSFLYSLVQRSSVDGAIEVAPADRADVRATLWPGREPPAHPDHPGLGKCEASGIVGGEQMWVETRPRGAALSELTGAFAKPELASVLVEVREALRTLHGVGLAHGTVRASRVVVGTDGSVVLIGVGQDREGSVHRDLAEMDALVRECGFASVAELVAGAPLRRVVIEGRVREPDGNESIELTAGSVDEVKVDLGPDESASGLLERWSAGEGPSAGESTRAPRVEPAVVAAEIPEVTISASRAALPPERTSPGQRPVPPGQAPVGEVTVTEVLQPGPSVWPLAIAAIAIVVAMVVWLSR
jgi:hypothetical protein